MFHAFPILNVFCTAFIGAIIFHMLSLPLPWLLGPIFAVLIIQFFVKGHLSWPPVFRNAGLVIVGVAIGQGFNLALFQKMSPLLFYMVILNILLMLFSVLLAWITTKFTSISIKTALTSSIPGGLSQLVLFAEEERDIDLAVVTFFHVIRVIAVVVVVPFIVSGHIVTGGNNEGSWSLLLFVVLLLAGASVWIGLQLKLPVAHFLTPILFIIILAFFDIKTPTVPVSLLHMAQLLIGAYIGFLLKPYMIRLPKKILIMGLFGTAALIIASYSSSVLLQWALHYSFATSFLSTAPGGLDQMGLLAAAVRADISVVTIFQLFRLLFIFLVVLPLLKLACRKWL